MSILNKKPYLGAISGGPDSIALLNMYHRHIKVVCTVKYNKRVNCQDDVDCVQELCDKYKIPLEVLDVTPEIYQQYQSENNFQNQARKIRYDFFCTVAKKYNINKILVAHQLDDFLETSYIEFAKNSKNLFYGIKDKSSYNELTIYRPLLMKYRKKTLQRYCDDLGLKYVLDSSNESDEYERNRVRKIITTMSNDQIHSLLKKTLKYNHEHRKLQVKVNDYFEKWKLNNFNIKMFKTFNENEQYYLIYEFLNFHKIYRPNQNKIHGIISFIQGTNGKEYRLDEKTILIKENFCLTIKIK